MYGVIILSSIGLLVVQVALDPPLWIGLGLVAVTSAIVLLVGRSHLRLAETFPELARLPVVRHLV